MMLFGKKKNEEKCTCGTMDSDAKNSCCEKSIDKLCSLKVLGSGCKSCHELYENAKKAVTELDLDVAVEYITDMEKVISYGIMSFPALLVNDKIVSVGKVLAVKEIEDLIERSLNA